MVIRCAEGCDRGHQPSSTGLQDGKPSWIMDLIGLGWWPCCREREINPDVISHIKWGPDGVVVTRLPPANHHLWQRVTRHSSTCDDRSAPHGMLVSVVSFRLTPASCEVWIDRPCWPCSSQSGCGYTAAPHDHAPSLPLVRVPGRRILVEVDIWECKLLNADNLCQKCQF